MWFSWGSPGKYWDTGLKYTTTISFHILPNISFTIILTLDAVCNVEFNEEGSFLCLYLWHAGWWRLAIPGADQ